MAAFNEGRLYFLCIKNAIATTIKSEKNKIETKSSDFFLRGNPKKEI